MKMSPSNLVAYTMRFCNDGFMGKYQTNVYERFYLNDDTHVRKVGMAAQLLNRAFEGDKDGKTHELDILYATQYLMVIIASQKDHLDHKKAYDDFEIDELMKKYPVHKND